MELYAYIVDYTTKKPIGGANVNVVDDMGAPIGLQTTSGGDGYFYLNDSRIDPNADQLYITAPGYNYLAFPAATVATYNTGGEDLDLGLVKSGSAPAGGTSAVTNALTSLLSLLQPKTAQPTPNYPTTAQPGGQISKILLPALLVGVIILVARKRKKRR